MERLLLLPNPRQLDLTGEKFRAAGEGWIALESSDAQALQMLFSMGCTLQSAFRQHAGAEWEIVAGAVPPEHIRIALMLVPGSVPHEQGYSLTITPQRVDVVASQPAGMFYAVQTLQQMVEQSGAILPTLRCRDWPDFPHRGVLLDISRNKVPSMETLYALIDLLASWKINQLQLYTEHTFAYRNHPVVWAQASPMTGEQILALDSYCRQRFIELVPNQSTFGHMRPWLIHEAYRDLAEAPNGCDTRWGHFDEPFSLNPGDPRSLDLVRSLLDELLPHFSSRQVNVGCDETVDLGQGRSRERVAALGAGRVYFDFLMQIYKEVKERHHTMQFWGDIIMEHPELVPELPRDVIALDWGYEAEHPFDQHGQIFSASGVPFFVCPGTSTWNTVAGRTDNALGNLRNAAANGLRHGAIGYLITDWGDNGHWQPLPVSYLGFAYGAALAWGYKANLDLDVPRALDLHAFQDEQGIMGRLAYDLGNIYQAPGIMRENASVLFGILQGDPQTLRQALTPDVSAIQVGGSFQETLERINAVIKPMALADMRCPDAALVQREFAWAADMLRHACWRFMWVLGENPAPEASPDHLASHVQELDAEFHHLWHARNRPGGFMESRARLEAMRSQYLAV